MLDRSRNYLSIFSDNLEIDYQLPKYSEALENIRKDIVDELIETGGTHFKTKDEILEILEKDPDQIMNFTARTDEELNERWNKLSNLISKYKARKTNKGILLSSDKFDKLNSKDLIVLTEDLGHRDRLNINGFSALIDSMTWDLDHLQDSLPWWKKLKWKIRGIFSRVKENREKSIGIDVLTFFKLVKLTTEESEKEYIDRSQPYLLAIEKAKEMGQQALIDQYLTGMFVNKYESILRAEHFNKAITEQQLVYFVKNSKKGINLSYIKNYARPIPDEVIEKKKIADKLYVFDNYCVLYYDPSKKSFAMTAKEQHEERRKKADPILFGLIEGSRKLYYIADWVDEYCDLTLEEFLKQSGLTEKAIEIPKTITL